MEENIYYLYLFFTLSIIIWDPMIVLVEDKRNNTLLVGSTPYSLLVYRDVAAFVVVGVHYCGVH